MARWLKRIFQKKSLESYNDVFADIVNVLLFDGEELMKPSELEDQAPRSAYKADGKLREVERDVAKRWKNGSVRIACIGVREPDGHRIRSCRCG